MTSELISKLQFLAEKYETADFIQKDPSKFMHQYDSVVEQELAAFLAANLAFGRRDQILKHIQMITDDWKKAPVDWVLSQKYKDFFVHGDKSFYRMYTDNDMLLFFNTIRMMLEKEGSIGSYVKKEWDAASNNAAAPGGTAASATNAAAPGGTAAPVHTAASSAAPLYLHQVIAAIFPAECKLLPHSKDSAAKKVNMLMRWLVRDNSPVDLGLWTWYKKTDLLMPLDTHVLQESVKFGLLAGGGRHSSGRRGSDIEQGGLCGRGGNAVPSGTLKTAIRLTEAMKEAFPDDPLKGDFALFGLGVDDDILKNHIQETKE